MQQRCLLRRYGVAAREKAPSPYYTIVRNDAYQPA